MPASSPQLFQRLKSSFAASAVPGATPAAVSPSDQAIPSSSQVVADVIPAAPQVMTDVPTAPVAEVSQADVASVQPEPPQPPTLPDPPLPQPPEPQPELPPEPLAQPVEQQPAEEVLAQAVPQVIDAATDTLHSPFVGGGTAKEAPMLQVTVENPVVDTAGGVQYVEAEKHSEMMPPEVDGFLRTVEDNHDQIPQEIVIADTQTGQTLPRVLAQPVVILPITPELEKEGKWKKTDSSIRWLLEWSWKMMKVFSGKVIYRQAEAAA